MKFKALRRAMTAAMLTTASIAVMVAAAEYSLTAVAEAGHVPLAQVQKDAAAQA